MVKKSVACFREKRSHDSDFGRFLEEIGGLLPEIGGLEDRMSGK